MDRPFVSIIMPCLNEEAHIEACLGGALAQDYPTDRVEVLVVDGGSSDATLRIAAAAAATDGRVRILENPDRHQAAGLNVGLRVARGDVIVRMDVHCEYSRDYVSACVRVLHRTGADNVGGAQRPRANTTFQRALCRALSSPLGVGGVKYRSEDEEGYVDTVFLGAFRRSVFETVGMYDSHAITNEDADLNQRIHAVGGAVYLSREIVVHYFPRTSLTALARQYFRYGKGRARTLLKHGRFVSPRPAIPFFMTASAATLLTIPSLRKVAGWAFGAYALATGYEALRVGADAGLGVRGLVWCIFPVLHSSHGLGFAAGLVTYALAPDWTEPERLEPRGATTARGRHQVPGSADTTGSGVRNPATAVR